MEVSESYSTEARIQLNFSSFMVIAIWVCLGGAIAFAIAFNLMVTVTVDRSGGSMFWFTSLAYAMAGFIFALIGAAASYPFYNMWCEKMRGQSVKGKFSFIKRGT